jgi:hypothetical protein
MEKLRRRAQAPGVAVEDLFLLPEDVLPRPTASPGRVSSASLTARTGSRVGGAC